ncbi:SDR family oxidoreductase [Microbacterium sp. CFBP9034]|uniref:SDR family oxidoreductase n=1 Tax=Microbacterium sp. CFBP9034 TaxID=3096540 RepID=UPI002A69916A|nr:SDR family oxidoreductase [Microbacterium sp. CFBP9034]MDY0910665.1 SDR family oxidoreductase [Microbacterium sp. CFBP9034]
MSRTLPDPVPLPDLAGRTALVTGASDGVGVEIARGLAGAGAHVLLPVRDRAKGERAADRIRATVPQAELALRDLDLASLTSVRTLAEELTRSAEPLDLVVLNAGIVLLGDPRRHVTDDGFELHFQTNFLGHAALVLRLLPLLQARAARIVLQCSLAAGRFSLDWQDLQSVHRYSPLRAYGMSKVALGTFGYELARRSAAESWRLGVNLCHPGVVPDTGMAPALRARRSDGPAADIARRLGATAEQAAQSALLAAVTDAPSPGFYGPSGVLHMGGPAGPQRPYRRLMGRTAGEWVWRLAEDALVTSDEPAS